ncbi:MAG: PIN domain-containing protein [Acidobacteria bacterium]|nr:PIN domain-containing protein [Acidobacteriota bacterium]MYE44403.1 PIN domain-containing protein [Acidobacteriota bacterium]
MTPVFLDTSALLALLDAEDPFHDDAKRSWERLLNAVRARQHFLLTHYAVVVESSALIARRLGVQAVRQLHEEMLPVAEVVWIDEKLHARATAAMFAAGRRKVSLVDWLSFEVMRDRRIRRAFTYDGDFEDQGFLPVP